MGQSKSEVMRLAVDLYDKVTATFKENPTESAVSVLREAASTLLAAHQLNTLSPSCCYAMALNALNDVKHELNKLLRLQGQQAFRFPPPPRS